MFKVFEMTDFCIRSSTLRAVNAFQTKMCFSKLVILRQPRGNSSESILHSF